MCMQKFKARCAFRSVRVTRQNQEIMKRGKYALFNGNLFVQLVQLWKRLKFRTRLPRFAIASSALNSHLRKRYQTRSGESLTSKKRSHSYRERFPFSSEP